MTRPEPRASTAPSAPAGSFAVHVNRRKVDLLWGIQAVLNGLLAGLLVAVVAFFLLSGNPVLMASVAPFLVILVYEASLLVWICRQWTTLRRPGPALVLDPYGIVLRTPTGEVRASWDAVAAVSVDRHLTGERLRVRLVPDSDPRAAGVATTGLSRRGRRTLSRQGLRYSGRILAVDRDALLRAFWGYSGGRVRPTAA